MRATTLLNFSLRLPFARPGSGFTRAFEDLVAWLVTKAGKTSVCPSPGSHAHRGRDLRAGRG